LILAMKPGWGEAQGPGSAPPREAVEDPGNSDAVEGGERSVAPVPPPEERLRGVAIDE